MIGRVVAQYRITAKLGEGGMGVVYRADDTALGRSVALKFIRDNRAQDPDARARFLSEARAAAALNHPNICTIHQVLEADIDTGQSVPVLVMELIDGESLADRIAREGALPFTDVQRIASEIADGLADAHAHGLVHRDLKPHNVMITASGRAKILDFGLAKPAAVESDSSVETATAAVWSPLVTRAGEVVGTAAYMSPEQALGKPADSRSDVFAFGVLLYEMVTGRRPFDGGSATEAIANVIAGSFVPAVDRRSDLPPALDRIIRRCLEKDPAHRYADTRDLVRDLREMHALETASRSAQLVTPVRSANPMRRKFIVGAAAGVAAAVAAALFINSFNTPQTTTPSAAPVHTQVTFVNDTSYPALSPDGALLAFVRGEPWGQSFETVAARAPQKVVIQNLTTGQTIDVGECQPCRHVQWSHDGSRLYFLDGRGVVRADRQGVVERRFTAESAIFLTLAPDGSAFATSRLAAKHLAVTDLQSGVSREIPVTGDFTWIRAIDWSPSVKHVAVVTSVNNRMALKTINADNASQVTAVDEEATFEGIAWAPSNDGIYYLKAAGLSRELWKASLDAQYQPAGSATALLTGLQAGPNFSISADGQMLAYTRETRYANLWIAPLSSSLPPKALTTGTHLDQFPAVSPDGSDIAFVRSDGRASDVFILPRAGGTPRRVTTLGKVTGGPAWSPDGQFLAFCADDAEARRVWTIPSNGGAPTPLRETHCTSGSEVPVRWAPGREILYQRDGNRNYHAIDPATMAETPLLATPDVGWAFGPVPHERAIALMWNRQDGRGAWVLPVTGPARFVAQGVWPLSWSADGSALYGFKNQTSEIVSVTLASGRTEVRRNLLPARVALVPAITPDLRDVVYSAHAILADVWTVKNFDPAARR